MKNQQVRQGDVYLRPIASIPTEAKPAKKDPRGVVLAEGEATGHAHTIADGGVALLELGDRRFLRAEKGGRLEHQEHSTIRVAPGLYEVVVQREYDDAEEWRRVAD